MTRTNSFDFGRHAAAVPTVVSLVDNAASHALAINATPGLAPFAVAASITIGVTTPCAADTAAAEVSAPAAAPYIAASPAGLAPITVAPCTANLASNVATSAPCTAAVPPCTVPCTVNATIPCAALSVVDTLATLALAIDATTGLAPCAVAASMAISVTPLCEWGAALAPIAPVATSAATTAVPTATSLGRQAFGDFGFGNKPKHKLPGAAPSVTSIAAPTTVPVTSPRLRSTLAADELLLRLVVVGGEMTAQRLNKFVKMWFVDDCSNNASSSVPSNADKLSKPKSLVATTAAVPAASATTTARATAVPATATLSAPAIAAATVTAAVPASTAVSASTAATSAVPASATTAVPDIVNLAVQPNSKAQSFAGHHLPNSLLL